MAEASSSRNIKLDFDSRKVGWRQLYRNPWPNFHLPSVKDIVTIGRDYVFGISKDSSPTDAEELEKNLPVYGLTNGINEPVSAGIRVTWLGHASLIVQMNKLTILTDPVLSKRCSFTQWAGPSRYRPVPKMGESTNNILNITKIVVDELKIQHIDAVIISHNHFDHLDTESVVALSKKFPDIVWLVPAGVDDYMRKTLPNSYKKNIKALEWWGNYELKEIKFTFVPAKHWSGRGAIDRFKTLWGGWCIGNPDSERFYFAGDTGYCDQLFKLIGERFNGFDCAAIPIGAYCPRRIMAPQHVDPEEAVKMHQDLRAKQSVGIHWGTFALAYEPYMEPPEKLNESLNKHKIPLRQFITMDHGETLTFPVQDDEWKAREERRNARKLGVGASHEEVRKPNAALSFYETHSIRTRGASQEDLAQSRLAPRLDRNEFLSHEDVDSKETKETNLDQNVSLGGIIPNIFADKTTRTERLVSEKAEGINAISSLKTSVDSDGSIIPSEDTTMNPVNDSKRPSDDSWGNIRSLDAQQSGDTTMNPTSTKTNSPEPNVNQSNTTENPSETPKVNTTNLAVETTEHPPIDMQNQGDAALSLHLDEKASQFKECGGKSEPGYATMNLDEKNTLITVDESIRGEGTAEESFVNVPQDPEWSIIEPTEKDKEN